MVHLRLGSKNDMVEIANILVTVWQDCYKDFLPASFLQSLSVEHQIARHTKAMEKGTIYMLAEDDHLGLMGFISYGKSRFDYMHSDIEIYTLYVSKVHQGQGIGQQLLNWLIQEVSSNAMSVGVEVMEKNPYKSFYEKNGFEKVITTEMDLGDFKLNNIIYNKNQSF